MIVKSLIDATVSVNGVSVLIKPGDILDTDQKITIQGKAMTKDKILIKGDGALNEDEKDEYEDYEVITIKSPDEEETTWFDMLNDFEIVTCFILIFIMIFVLFITIELVRYSLSIILR